MELNDVLVLGGSGFVGCHVAHLLAERNCTVTVPTRRRERAKHLLVLPTVDVIETNIHDQAVLDQLVRGKDAVINLVGVLHSRHGSPYGPDFAQAHVELPRKLAAACRKAGVRRLVHISALNASSAGPSQYLRSKGDGERVLLEQQEHLDLTLFRPSVMFGPGDSFLNRFAGLLKWAPVFPIGRAEARFQPVFVEDVGQVIVDSLTRLDALGQIYPLCGPKVYTLRQLVQYVGEVTGHRRPVIGLPETLARLQAGVLELLPVKLMSVDNLDSMDVDAVCPEGCTLPFGHVPTALEAVGPLYLGQRVPRRRYYGFRVKARR